MVKKKGVAKKKTISKISKKPKKTESKVAGGVKVEKALVKNFVSLQKVMTNLGVKFDHLAGEISKLLELFEISAKTLAKKDFDLGKNNQENKDIVGKLDDLLEQNKVIARGLSLLYEPSAERPVYSHQIPHQMPSPGLHVQPSIRVQRPQKAQPRQQAQPPMQTPPRQQAQPPMQTPPRQQTQPLMQTQNPPVQNHQQESESAENMGDYEKSQSLEDSFGSAPPVNPNFKKLPKNPATENPGV